MTQQAGLSSQLAFASVCRVHDLKRVGAIQRCSCARHPLQCPVRMLALLCGQEMLRIQPADHNKLAAALLLPVRNASRHCGRHCSRGEHQRAFTLVQYHA